jgi:hypothetical protein
MKTILSRLLILAAAAASAQAQNSDLGLLLGASVSHNSVSPGRIVHNKVHGGGQINYAIQLHETVAGRLYLELPLVLTGGATSTVAPGAVTNSVSGAIFFTPGLRWKFSPAHRLSFYAAAGGGLGSFERTYNFVGGGQVVTDVGRVTTGAFGIGAGIDVRITRLLSFRAEYRDAMTRGNIDGAVHHSLFMFGIGLHF